MVARATGDRPTVLFLHPSDELYGADRSLLDAIREVADICRPVVILPDDITYQGKLSSLMRAEGIEVRTGPLPVLRRQYLTARAFPRWSAKAVMGTLWLLRSLRLLRPAAIVTNTTAIAAGPLAAFLVKTPHVWFVREIIETPAWYRGLVRSLAQAPRGKVVAVSSAVSLWLGSLGERGPIVIHNAVPTSSGLRPLPTAKVAAYLGRLSDWKGWKDFVAAAATVHERLGDSQFHLVGGTAPGSGRPDDDVSTTLRSVDPSGSWLQWQGEVDDPRSAIQAARVIVVPSRRPEPFGRVAAEAMAEGRPVIASDHGGLPEQVLDTVTGLLVRPGDPQGLARAMELLLDDGAACERMGHAALERHRRLFSPEVHARRWRRLLSQVLNASGRLPRDRQPA